MWIWTHLGQAFKKHKTQNTRYKIYHTVHLTTTAFTNERNSLHVRSWIYVHIECVCVYVSVCECLSVCLCVPRSPCVSVRVSVYIFLFSIPQQSAQKGSANTEVTSAFRFIAFQPSKVFDIRAWNINVIPYSMSNFRTFSAQGRGQSTIWVNLHVCTLFICNSMIYP